MNSESASPRGAAATILFAGIGSSHGVDCAGWVIAGRLREFFAGRDNPQIRMAVIPADLLDWLPLNQEGGHVSELHLCDAILTDTHKPGLLRMEWIDGCGILTENGDIGFSADHDQISLRMTSGTHGMSMISVLSLAGVMNRLPRRVIIWGIAFPSEIHSESSAELTDAILSDAVSRISRELATAAEISMMSGS